MIKLNNKGFTLTEVLAVIIVLIAILTISLPDLSSTVETVKKEDVSSGITSYAELYLSDNLDAIKKHMGRDTSCYIETSDLYDYGYKVKESDNQYVVYNFSNLEFNSVNSVEGISKCDISIEDLDNIGNGEELNNYIEDDIDKFNLYNKVKIGDYVKMIPPGTTFSIPSDWNGVIVNYNNSNKSSISDTQIWRVLKKNEDHTIEVISKDPSTIKVEFSGIIAYKKYVYYLNEISKQFINLNFANTARHFGYDPDHSVEIVVNDEFVDDLYKPDPNKLDPSSGGRDTFYTTDYNLIENINSSIDDKITFGTDVFVSSRNYFKEGKPYWCVMKFGSSGELGDTFTVYGSRYISYGSSGHVRPIITLKNDVTYINEGANGTSEKPYILG